MKTNKMTFAEVVAAFEAAGFGVNYEFGHVTYQIDTAADGMTVSVLREGVIMTFSVDKEWRLSVWSRERFNEELARRVAWARKSIAA